MYGPRTIVRPLALSLATLAAACGADDVEGPGGDTEIGDSDGGSMSGNPTGSPTGDPSGNDGGTTGNSTDETDSNAADGSGTGSPEPEGFDDEFDDPATLSQWTRLHETEGEDAPYSTLDVSMTSDGRLTMTPTAGGWYGDFSGPFLYKDLSGDFVVEVTVSADRVGSPGSPPTGLYNSAGLMVRDPASSSGSENWIIHNVGNQSLEVGLSSEGKTTTNSNSVLDLTPVSGMTAGMLRICRVGSEFILARQLDGEDAWMVTNSYNRSDMPGALQVGLMTNGWNSNGTEPDLGASPDVVGTFEYIRMWRPDGAGDCTATAE